MVASQDQLMHRNTEWFVRQRSGAGDPAACEA
jgi:hypothetical protein